MSLAWYTGTNQVMPGFAPGSSTPDSSGSIYPKPKTHNPCFRFTDKDVNKCERLVISWWWFEQIALYGQKVTYWQNPYNTLSADGIPGAGPGNIYGEEPTKVFKDPKAIIILMELNENAVILQKYGFDSDDEFTAYIHISAFYHTFGELQEPKAGDIIELTEFGDDRPEPRTGKKFEITERLDEDVARINPLAGHYVWQIKAKRYDYSFEPGLSAEGGSDQVYDDKFSGLLDGGSQDRSSPKSYDGDLEELSKQIFDYSGFDYDNVYGGYGNTQAPENGPFGPS
tara:strand:- start:948 stop:1799 length:852 start_codon:yes stop_codon:yes gene_type:complete